MSRSDTRHRQAVQHLLGTVDIQVDGSRPWDVLVQDERFFARVLRDGALGLGEAYMERWWRADRLDQLFERLAGIEPHKVPIPWSTKWHYLRDRFINRQRRSRSHVVAERHYNLGNDLFRAMLDSRMTYSCGYWREAHTLEDAQAAKLDLVCRKLGLRPGQRVLDIGCGWGSFVKFAAEHYGVSALGINNSNEQTSLGRELCAGLPIEIRVQDYRAVSGRYDHVVSIGMFEHVGPRNYRTFFEIVDRCLKDDGLFLLHTIGSHGVARSLDPWTRRFIFPDGTLPSIRQIGVASERRLVMEDWQNIGADYAPTLMAWFANFDAAWPALRQQYSETFYRMWKYFLLGSAGSFQARRNNVWQIVFSRHGVRGGYVAVR